MQLRNKLIVAFAVLALLVGLVFGVQFYYLSQEPNLSGPTRIDETFTAGNFIYGLQNWVPYASKLPVVPGANVNGDSGFYVMFVDLNATSNLNATFPCVRVDYAFTGLHGTAAFHIYGYIHQNSGLSWTNRVEGDGGSGFYVSTDQQSTTTLTDAHAMEDYDHVYVKVANAAGASFDDFGNDTYFMKFEKDGGGLNSLHITTDPSIPTGQVTNTGNQTGTFYADFTGDRVQDDFLLLVAVNGTIGNDFSLHLRSSVP